MAEPGRLAITTGTGLEQWGLATAGHRARYAGVHVREAGAMVILLRHADEGFTPAHLIDHNSAMDALVAAGCDRVLAVCSVGSLRADWGVGTVMCPDDFFAPQATHSRYADARGHRIVGFDEPWRRRVLDAWRGATRTPIVDGGVYAQTPGPRFETRAETQALASLADVVGMTIASECIAANEAGLAHCAIGIVDNLANGINGSALTADRYHDGVASNREWLHADLGALVAQLLASAS